MTDKQYVVIVNRNAYISPIRHIVTIHYPYDENEFKEWYYNDYHEFDDDEFIHCLSKAEMEETVRKVTEEYMTNEIIKGLENVMYHLPASSHKAMIDVAIDYINEQQAEVERLTDRNKRLGEGVGLLLNNENGVELITAEHMKIINDKRAKEKAKKNK